MNRRYTLLLFILSGLISFQETHAQKYLDLEYARRVNPFRYSIGDSFTYQTGDDGIWYEATIRDLHRESGSIYLNNTLIKIEDITQVRTYRNRGWSRVVSTSLLTFGASWLFWSAVGTLSSPDDVDWKSAAVIGGGSAALGMGIRIPFSHETHRLGQKRRLRILDLRL